MGMGDCVIQTPTVVKRDECHRWHQVSLSFTDWRAAKRLPRVKSHVLFLSLRMQLLGIKYLYILA